MTFQVGDIFEYHQSSDSYLAFIAKDERVVLFKPATAYSKYYLKYCAPLTHSNHAQQIEEHQFKNFNLTTCQMILKPVMHKNFRI